VPSEIEYSARINDPKKYSRVRRQNDRFGKGIHVKWGILPKRKNDKKAKTEIQAICFSKKKFTLSQVKAWLKRNRFKYISLEGEAVMAKKKVSRKVLDALKKGRQKLASLRKKTSGRRRKHIRRIPEKLETIIIKGGSAMAGKKRRRRKAHRKYHGAAGEFMGRRRKKRAKQYHGEFGGEFMGRRRRRRHVARYSGGLPTKGVIGSITNAGLMAAGGIAGAFAAKYVPIPNAKIKAAVPLILGLALSFVKFGQKPPISTMATGAAAVGMLSIIKQFMPQIPTLAGDDEEQYGYLPTSPEEAAILGLEDYSGDEYEPAMGALEDFSEDAELMGEIEQLQSEPYLSPADIG
jgi:hypothetical protein